MTNLHNKKRPTRILHLINDLGFGGAQKVILNLVKEIDRDRFNPIVGIWGSMYGHEMVEEIKRLNIEVVDFQARNKFDFKSFYSIYRYLSRNSIDILHTHLSLMNVIGRIAGKCAKTPWIVSTYHNLLQVNHPILCVLEKVTLPLSDITTSVSFAAQKTYFSTSEEFSVDALRLGRKHFTIYNSVNTEEIRSITKNVNVEQTRRELGLDDQFVFTCVGRFYPFKGHRYLIKAVDHLRETHPSVLLLIVGDGPLQNKLMQEATKRGLCEHIRFLGYRKDVYRILTVSNALVHPSTLEGFGLVITEAMACGLPVVSTNLPSIAEVVLHKKTGILVPPGDSQALSEAMATIVDNPALATTYGTNGKQRVETAFSSQAITRQYETLYKTLAELQ